MASLNKLTQRITAVLSVQQVSLLVLRETMRCVAPDLVLLFLRSRNALHLQGIRCRKAAGPHGVTPVHRVGQCLCGLAVKNNRPIYSLDIHRDRRCTWDECKRAGVRSFAALPLSCGGRVLGVLGLASRRTSRDFARQSGFLETLANSVAIAMRNAELYESLHEKSTELDRSGQTLRDLGGRLIRAQEEERARVARELHDDLNQRVSLMAIELEVLAGGLPQGTDSAADRLQKLAAIGKRLSSDVHRLSYRLHPYAIEQLGLAAALGTLCREFSESQPIRFGFSKKSVPRRIPPDVALCLYRTAQESIWNVIRHSGAKQATVELSGTAGFISLTVTDSGMGFEPQEAGRRGGLGLVSIRERLRLVGGQLEITSASGEGTRIQARVPLVPRATREPGLADTASLARTLGTTVPG